MTSPFGITCSLCAHAGTAAANAARMGSENTTTAAQASSSARIAGPKAAS
jgi:hypothetical protein